MWDLIHDEFVDPDAIDDQTLLFGAARGMVDSLGDTGHSSFLDPDEAKVFRAALDGELIGLGISIEYQNREPVVVAPIKNSPAEEAGIRSGDVIVEIDGNTNAGNERQPRFRSICAVRKANPVTLTIDRANAAVVARDHRGSRTRRSRSGHLVDPADGMAIVQLHEFSAGSGQALRDALQEIVATGNTQGIVLDLRNNPGGYVSEAITVASQFMPEGSNDLSCSRSEAVRTNRLPRSAMTAPRWISQSWCWSIVLRRRPLKSSRARCGTTAARIVVGERTYGTGTVVSTFELEGGSALALGTAFWKTPDGDLVWKVGLMPDIEVRQASGSEIIDISDGQMLTERPARCCAGCPARGGNSTLHERDVGRRLSDLL